MAYKVLGQASTTAATPAPVTINLVKDPSLEGLFPLTRTSNNGSTALLMNDNNSYWRFSNTGSGTVSLTNGTPAAFGSYALKGTGTNWYLYYGASASANASAWPNVSGTADFSTAIPVTGGRTYYFAWYYKSDGGTQNSNFEVSWRNSSNSHLSQNSASSASTGTTWVKTTTSFTAPTDAVYATFRFSTGSGGVFDAISFSDETTLYATFVEPLLPSAAATTAPFDKKTNGYASESYVTNSTISYAGAFNTIYTVPATKETVASTLSVANMSSVATSYRVAVVPSGETLAKKHMVFFDTPIGGNSTQTITIGMTLQAGDTVRVAADTATVSATLFGSES